MARLLIVMAAGLLGAGCGGSSDLPRDAGGPANDATDASDRPVGDASLDLNVGTSNAPGCPESIADLCAHASSPCPTWSSAQEACTQSSLDRIAKSCGGYDVLSQSGPPATGSTNFYFDPVSGDLVGVVENAGFVPPPDSNAPACIIPSGFVAPSCTPAACLLAPATNAITGLAAGVWTWVGFPQAVCRDGSSTGIGINLGTSPRLLIYFEGGGACFSQSTCAGNPASFGSADLRNRAASTMDEFGLGVGILDRTNAANPVRDWTFVYVPYCSGDLHSGNSVTALASGTQQHFVGYANVGVYLDRLVPTFPAVAQVMVSGISAGGFGAAFNYAQVARAFTWAPVTLLDDSGPLMRDPYLATCLQDALRNLWGLDGTVLTDCGNDCATPGSFFLDSMMHLAAEYPKVAFGLAESTGDATIATFYGWGTSSCTGTTPLTEGTFTAGLLDVRAQLAAEPNFGEFIFAGTDHTTIQSAAFYTRTSGVSDGGAPEGGEAGAAPTGAGTGVPMTEWVAGLLDGGATNAGP